MFYCNIFRGIFFFFSQSLGILFTCENVILNKIWEWHQIQWEYWWYDMTWHGIPRYVVEYMVVNEKKKKRAEK